MFLKWVLNVKPGTVLTCRKEDIISILRNSFMRIKINKTLIPVFEPEIVKESY